MTEMDTSAMLNQMYFTIMSLLPILLFIIFAGNALVVVAIACYVIGAIRFQKKDLPL